MATRKRISVRMTETHAMELMPFFMEEVAKGHVCLVGREDFDSGWLEFALMSTMG